MTLLTLEEAAVRIGASREIIEEWVRSGLVTVQVRHASDRPDGEKVVQEEELFETAERAGWFALGAENWDSAEDAWLLRKGR